MRFLMRPNVVAGLTVTGLAGLICSTLAVDVTAVNYKIETGRLTNDRQKVYSPYAPDSAPFWYTDRIQPPPPNPPKYLVLDQYTPKLFYLPPLAPTIYRNGNRYSLLPKTPPDFSDGGSRGSQFLDLGIMYARYVPEAIAPPIHFPRGDTDESLTRYDPSAPPEFLITAGWQSADVFKDIDKTSEASFPLYGDPEGDKVHRTSIYYAKASMAYKGFALTATYLESTDLLQPRKATGDSLMAAEAGEFQAASAALSNARHDILAAVARGELSASDLIAANGQFHQAAEELRQSQNGGGNEVVPSSLPRKVVPQKEKYQEVDVSLNYSHEVIPQLLDGTIGYTAFLIPDTGFWGTGFVGEFYTKLAFTPLPHMRPNVTFSLFNSSVELLRGKFFDFRWDTYGLTVFKSDKLKTRVELNPFVGTGLDHDLIGNGPGWTAFRFGARMPVYFGKNTVLNMDLNYAIPINGHSDSTNNFRTDLGEVGLWGGVSLSFKF